MIGQDLYRRGYSTLLLKCLTKEQAQYVLQEIHDGAYVIIYSTLTPEC